MLLIKVSSQLKEAREKVNEQRTGNRQIALLHALRVDGVREKRKGTKKRYFFSPRKVWDREDWIRELAKPASEGLGNELTAITRDSANRWQTKNCQTT